MVGYSNFKKGYRLYSLNRNQFNFSRDVKFFESIFPFKDYITEKTDTTKNVFQDLNRIKKFDGEYPEIPNDDENRSLNSDYKSQSDSSHSSVPGEGVDTNDFPSGNFRNDAQSSDDTFATHNEQFAHWIDAMNNKIDALLRNDTWEITEVPRDRKAI
ncbi:hypothetical protein Tco_1010266, partial [Tanacetum coccineum]